MTNIEQEISNIEGKPDRPFRPVAIAPTYNNASTLRGILDRLAALGLPIIVVNDGATDGTAGILEQWLRERPGAGTVITHDRNRGKGAAMMTGFAAASQRGHTHAVTMDTDGQLDPEQIPQLLDAASKDPDAMILGYRDDTAPDYPAKSRFGRRFSNLCIRLESGAPVRDSQCGLRVYPLGLMDAIVLEKCRAKRFGFETEIITRAAWAGCRMVEVQVACRYMPQEQRVSHFKPGRDSLRALGMHLRLMGRALVPWPHRNVWPLKTSGLFEKGPNGACLPGWRDLAAWVSPRKLWQQIRHEQEGRTALAAGVALGAFIANLPIYPFQTLASIYMARRLHLHPLPVVVGSHVSTPPVGPALIVLAICVGHLMLTGSWPSINIDWQHEGLATLFGRFLVDWIVGSIIVGAACAALAFVTIMAIMKLLPRPK